MRSLLDSPRPQPSSSPSRAERARRRLLHVPALVATTALVVLASLAASAAPAHAANPEKRNPPISTPPTIGLHIPWAIGGPRIEADGTTVIKDPTWPAFPVPALRLWDTRTAWLNLEPKNDAFDWSNLDAHIAQAHAHGTTDITLVLSGTPTWAAESLNPADAPWLGPGSAAPPASLADWEDFVTAVVRRYKGLITAYEIGNEVNVPMFWRGSSDQLRALVQAAASIIKTEDPAARVVGPAPLLADLADVGHAGALWTTLASIPLDAMTIHWYPRNRQAERDTALMLESLARIARTLHLEHMPLWITETNVRSTSSPEALATTLGAIQHKGYRQKVEKVFLYAWSDLASSPTLAMTGRAPGAIALERLVQRTGQPR